ncbi:unnamed protein product [Peniophora sp. CBMAI 1063]|nr:unnamed protein product [Peniophora sp. CBMAI 1063]
MPLLPVSASIACAVYLLLVRLTRWRVYNRLHRKYAHLDPVRNPKARMTATEAQDITHASVVWDMGALLANALSFAIVRTYAIPSISKILCSSKELKAGPSVSKRYLDTAIIAGTWSFCPISATDPPTELYASETKGEPKADPDPRTFIGIARMNWLHAHYPISNDDYLYTLSLFILEPVRWAQKYGWRSLSPLEVQARHVFYTRVGELMGIRDIPDTVEGLIAWSEEYEEQHMVPADTNKEVVSGMMTELSSVVPAFARGIFQRIIICLFDERTRVAMGLPEQPAWMHSLVGTAAWLFKFTQGHLLLPRFSQVPLVPMKAPRMPTDGSLARMHPAWPVTKPWYLPRPTGLQRVLERVMIVFGLKSEEDLPGPKYRSEGYRLEELGPLRWKDAGHAEVMKLAEDMMGCPVRGAWAREG